MTITLLPISDISVSGAWEIHNTHPSYAAYLASQDNDWAFINGERGTTVTGTLVMKMGWDSSITLPSYFETTAFRVKGVTEVGSKVEDAFINVHFEFGSGDPNGGMSEKITTMGRSNYMFSREFAEYAHNGIPSTPDELDVMELTITVSVTVPTSFSAFAARRFKMDYIAVEMDIEDKTQLYIRQNNVWKQCVPYKKINGVWVQQDASFLGSSNIAQLYYKGG